MNTVSTIEATSRLNELIAAAGTGEPQIITSNGLETAVLISYEEYRRLKAKQKSLVEFLRDSPLSGSDIDLERSKADAYRASLNLSQQSNQQLLAALNDAYADGPTEKEQEYLRQMTASQRRLVENEW